MFGASSEKEICPFLILVLIFFSVIFNVINFFIYWISVTLDLKQLKLEEHANMVKRSLTFIDAKGGEPSNP